MPQKWLLNHNRIRLDFKILPLIRQNFTTSAENVSEIKSPEKIKKKKEIPSDSKKSHALKLNSFFKKNPHVAAVKRHIPEKYLALKRLTPPENLYLIDSHVAKKAATYIVPDIRKNEEQIVCETNAGLGLITSELLTSGIKLVRMYESCPDFRTYLKSTFECYKGQVELFTKDIFLLHRYEYIDKQDHGNRVEQFFKGVPRKNWDDGPVLTIIGPLPHMNFIRFLMKSLLLQTFITSVGRIQLYTFMRPRDYIILTAGPHLNLHTYKRWSIFFNLFFEYKLLDKFPRDVFLPWQSPKTLQTGRYAGQIDNDLMYFVRVNFKKNIPVVAENLLPFYSFVMQFFGQGTNRVIPTLEKWVPGSGVDVMIPKLNHLDYFRDMNIFTKFGELNPRQVLAVFQEMITHPDYKKSHFMDIIESHLIKSETVETSLDEHLEKTVIADHSDFVESDATL